MFITTPAATEREMSFEKFFKKRQVPLGPNFFKISSEKSTFLSLWRKTYSVVSRNGRLPEDSDIRPNFQTDNNIRGNLDAVCNGLVQRFPCPLDFHPRKTPKSCSALLRQDFLHSLCILSEIVACCPASCLCRYKTQASSYKSKNTKRKKCLKILLV